MAFVLVLARMAMGTAIPGSWWGLVALPLAVAARYGYCRLVKRHAQTDIALVTRFIQETVQAG